jgi:hypothetical protein
MVIGRNEKNIIKGDGLVIHVYSLINAYYKCSAA